MITLSSVRHKLNVFRYLLSTCRNNVFPRYYNYNEHYHSVSSPRENVFQQKTFYPSPSFFKTPFPSYDGIYDGSLIHNFNVLGVRPYYVNTFPRVQHKRRWRRRGRQRNKGTRFMNTFMQRGSIHTKNLITKRLLNYNRSIRNASQNILFRR